MQVIFFNDTLLINVFIHNYSRVTTKLFSLSALSFSEFALSLLMLFVI